MGKQEAEREQLWASFYISLSLDPQVGAKNLKDCKDRTARVVFYEDNLCVSPKGKLGTQLHHGEAVGFWARAWSTEILGTEEEP